MKNIHPLKKTWLCLVKWWWGIKFLCSQEIFVKHTETLKRMTACLRLLCLSGIGMTHRGVTKIVYDGFWIFSLLSLKLVCVCIFFIKISQRYQRWDCKLPPPPKKNNPQTNNKPATLQIIWTAVFNYRLMGLFFFFPDNGWYCAIDGNLGFVGFCLICCTSWKLHSECGGG